MTISLAGRVSIVTGGARGLGRVMAEALVRAGGSVFITARSSDQVARAVAELNALRSGRCAGIDADVTDLAACRSILTEATALLGPPAVLVNNAGVGLGSFLSGKETEARDRPFHTVEPGVIETIIRTNLIGAFNMYLTVVPGMIERRFGRIVNISTSRPTMRRPNGGPYGPTKAALEASTHIWSHELRGTGVTANVLLPGGMSDTALIPGDGIGKRAKPFSPGKGPLGLEGTNSDLLPPEIMGPPIVWLASDQSAEFSGRRFVARDWDPDLAPDAAALRAMQEPSDAPVIM